MACKVTCNVSSRCPLCVLSVEDLKTFVSFKSKHGCTLEVSSCAILLSRYHLNVLEISEIASFMTSLSRTLHATLSLESLFVSCTGDIYVYIKNVKQLREKWFIYANIVFYKVNGNLNLAFSFSDSAWDHSYDNTLNDI